MPAVSSSSATGTWDAAVRFLVGPDRRTSSLFSVAGFGIGFLVPTYLFLTRLFAVDPRPVEGYLAAAAAVLAVVAAVLNAYFDGGFLVSVGVVLFLPLRVLVGVHVLDGVGFGVAIGWFPPILGTLGTAFLVGACAYAVGSLPDERVDDHLPP